MKNVFITGGAGFIGSHCAIALIENGYKPIIIDNFSNSRKSIIKNLETITKKKIIFYKVDLKNKKKLKSIFNKHKCYCVIHCAGFKSVEESIKQPITYFNNNIHSTLTLLDCMQEGNINKLIFSSSATVYDFNEKLPLKENSKTGNTQNPYGTSKYIIEQILSEFSKYNEKWAIRIARYFNPISNHPSGLISENSKKIPDNLFPYIVGVAKKKLYNLKIFGNNYPTKDGTCIRDYIHVMDLAYAHLALLKKSKLQKGLKIYNFGTGKGTSVLEAVRIFEKITGITIPLKFVNRRKGDIAMSYCDAKKANKELNWKTRYNLNQAIEHLKKTI